MDKQQTAAWYARLCQESNKTFLPLFADEHRYLVMMGGGGSGKSITAGRKLLERCRLESGHRFLVVRKVARTLRQSCWQQLVAQASDLDLHAEVNVSDMTMRFPNGSEILFSGLDDVEKLKSIYSITGIWIEEASEILEEDFNQLDIRLRGDTKYYKQIIITFNPISALHWLKRRFFDNADPRAITHRSTYKDNRFLDEDSKQTLESFRETDPYYYQVYALGEWGVTGKTIFDAQAVMDRLQGIPEGKRVYFAGRDVREDTGGGISVYKAPERGVPYVIGADTAGNGSDYFVAQVLDNRTGEQVAVLRQQMDEPSFAAQLEALGYYYNTALIGVEVNFSTYVTLELERRQYPRQYVRQAIDSFTHKPVERFGFHTNSNTRETIISGLVDACRDISIINDRATLEEMLTFVRNEKMRAEAELGAHDDCIMSLAIAHFIRPQQSYTIAPEVRTAKWTDSMWDDYRNASGAEREYLLEKWGSPE